MKNTTTKLPHNIVKHRNTQDPSTDLPVPWLPAQQPQSLPGVPPAAGSRALTTAVSWLASLLDLSCDNGFPSFPPLSSRSAFLSWFHLTESHPSQNMSLREGPTTRHHKGHKPALPGNSGLNPRQAMQCHWHVDVHLCTTLQYSKSVFWGFIYSHIRNYLI